MKTYSKISAIVICCSVLLWSAANPVSGIEIETMKPSPVESAGFSSALFDVVSILTILDRGDCVSIRFYNIISDLEGGVGSVMAIGTNGIDSAGADINEIPGIDEPYLAYGRLMDDRILSINLSNDNAGTACENMPRNGYLSYSTTFRRIDLSDMIKIEGCTTLQIIPTEGENGISMTIQAVFIEN